MRNRFAVLVVVPVLALGVAACGSDDDPAVTAADLAETLQGEGPFTVFAPTGEAFGKVGDEALAPLLEPAGRDQLTKILTYHVVPGELSGRAAAMVGSTSI